MAWDHKSDLAEESVETRAEANRQTASLAGLAIALALVVGGLVVFRALHTEQVMEDCLMSGQSDCEVVALP